jgi:hypothetical protein
MLMTEDEEGVSNEKAYDDDTCVVHIKQARSDYDMGGYFCEPR